MRSKLLWFTVVYAVLILLSSCSVSKPVSHSSYSKNRSSASGKATAPKYIKNVAIGGKGGSKINMDVENNYRTSKTTADAEKANSKKAPDNNASAQQSVELVAEDTEAPPVKKVVPAEKHASKGKKHKRGHHHTEETPSINLDTEPLVDAVPAPGYIGNSGPSKGFVINKKKNIPCQVKYSGILCSVPQALSNLALYNFIDDWYGTDYQMGGNDKTGIDCSAFVQRLYLEVFGFSMVRTALEQFNNCTMVWNTDKLADVSDPPDVGA